MSGKREGFVYILTNETMPGIVKIGRTSRDPSRRADELFTTGVASPFKVCFRVRSPDCFHLEGLMHGFLADSRVSESREFFRIPASDAKKLLVQLHLDDLFDRFDLFLDGISKGEIDAAADKRSAQ